jgi:ATP-dependent Lon protease
MKNIQNGKKEINNKTNEVQSLIDKKVSFFKEVIQKSLIHFRENKQNDILAISDLNTCIENLEEINKKIDDINLLTDKQLGNVNSENAINQLQVINNDLSALFKNYGTGSLEDLLIICFGNNKLVFSEDEILKMSLLNIYFHPIGYKIFNKKDQKKDLKKTEMNKDDFYNKKFTNTTCFEIDYSKQPFYVKVYGIKIYFYNEIIDKGIVVFGTVDDIMLNFCNNEFILKKKREINENIPSDFTSYSEHFNHFIESLILKDYLIYSHFEIFERFSGHLSEMKKIKQMHLSLKIKEFISSDIFVKRSTLLHLLIDYDNYENQYLAYLLYDLLSNDYNGSVDTKEQIMMFNSFPWSIKRKFFESMKNTMQYTSDLNNINISKIPLEQQITLLQVSEAVKEKAMAKLKEVKSKSEDSGTKARQYLEGLLKIPFGIYRKEPVLNIVNQIKIKFNDFYKANNIDKTFPDIIIKENFTSVEIIQAVIKMQENIQDEKYESKYFKKNKKKIKTELECIMNDINKIKENIQNIRVVLDNSVHGHVNAKKQIERIIGQWINGENSGYCIGFEGPPGVGKTTLAKVGLSNILKDVNGSNRPFSLIQLGGESNGSTLHGHNYTYVGSTWGSIVQILMDKKCMNPIILIDEVDKISKTDQGREIIGILTHLLDQLQNECFQDKYFSGIDIDVSKVLFILSYNDPQMIDKILLDRVHRIKFGNLTLEEKIHISKNYVLPEISKKFGLEGMINIEDSVFKFIIEEYTNEPGIRKYKEILFEIIGEINLDILNKNIADELQLPIKITIEDIRNKYFKDKHEVKHKKIHSSSEVGLINALWANSIGQGGVLPLQVKFFPSNCFLELKLTGSLGDVMKESVKVSLTTAWNMTSEDVQNELIKKYNDVKNNQVCGIHIHCPDCATPKDGPSATTAFTIIIYSIFNNIKIKNYIGITGETSFDYYLTEIGGLEQKILGGIKAGITEFIYPSENEKDFKKFLEKYKDKDDILGIKFNDVNNIYEAMDIILDK